MTDWSPDVLGEDYERHSIELGDDPDGEGLISATLVRRRCDGQPRAAVLYVHGFSDYFFHEHVAEFFADRDVAFYALDLRKCGRSMRDGLTPHYASDLSLYDVELNESLLIIEAETGVPVIPVAHSTAGLTVSLWLNRCRPDTVIGVILNSPWFDMPGPAWMRSVGTDALKVVARLSPMLELPKPSGDGYGVSLHVSRNGEWDFNTDWKPIAGFPVCAGWLAGIRRGHAELQGGLDIGVPSLILRSRKSRPIATYGDKADSADLVLDVKHIARWAGCVGDRVSVVPLEGARHDVFLSLDAVRTEAFNEVETWLEGLLADRCTSAES